LVLDPKNTPKPYFGRNYQKKKGKYFGRRINGEFQLKFQRWMNIQSLCTCLKTEDLCTKGKST